MNLYLNRGSSLKSHHPNSICSTLIYFCSQETKDEAVLQKQKADPFSKGHPGKKTAGVSGHKYLCRHTRPGSRGKTNFFPADIRTSQCSIHQCNHNLCTQNRQSPRDDPTRSSSNQIVPEHTIRS